VLVYCAGEKGNTLESIVSLSERNLRRVAQNIVNRVNTCIQENGGNFQHLFELYLIFFVF
jgi:hypothetical protein